MEHYQEQLQQQHQHRQQGLGLSGAPWPFCGPEGADGPLELGGVVRLVVLDPLSLQLAVPAPPGTVADGPTPGPALFSVTRSVTLQDI